MKTLLTLATAAVMTLAAVERAPIAADDRAAVVLTQVRTALGGEQKLTAVKAISADATFRRAVGTRTSEGSISLLIVRPDKLRRSEESKFLGTTAERIATFDGSQAWEETVNAARVGGGGGGFDHGGGGGGFDHSYQAGGAAGGDHNHDADQFRHDAEPGGQGGALTLEQVNAARVRRMKMELQRWTVALLSDSNQPFTDAGQAHSPDGPADVLETKDEAGRPVRYFIDPASHMPLMVQYQEVRPQAMPAKGAPAVSTTAMHLSDYKKVDGVLLPHQIDISIDGRASESWTIEKFKINPTVKADVFKKK